MQTPPADPRAWRRDLIGAVGVVLLAFAVRFVYLLQARDCPMFDGVVVDGESYWTWSDEIVAGNWVGDRIFYQAPLYPYFLALTKLALGADLWNVRVVQIALGAVACGILALAGVRFFGRAAGIATGVLAALYPPAIFFDGCIQKAAIGFLWMALLLLSLAAVRARPGFARWLAVGLALGALMLTREESVLLAPVLAAWGILAFRDAACTERAGWMAAYGVGLALLLAPVALRNRAVGGELVLTTSQAGPNFWIGNNPRADGTYVPLRPGRHNPAFERQDAFDLAAAESGRSLTPREVSSFWTAKSLAWIRAEPRAWLALLVRKAGLLVNAYEVSDADDIYFYARYASVLRVPFAVWHMGVLVPLAVLGIALTWQRRRELAVLHAVLATLSAGVVLFFVFARYRYPVVSVLLPFAGAGLVEAFVRARAGRWRELAMPIALAALAAVAANAWTPWPRDHSLAAAWANSAVVQARKGDHEYAIVLGRRALALKPGSSEYWSNAGLSWLALKQFDAAAEAFQRALDLRPADTARAHLRLGLALGQAGRLDQSLTEIDASLALRPDDREALGYRVTALVQLGRRADAVATLRRLVQIAPDDGEARLKLAWILATAPEDRVRDGARALELATAVDRESGGADARVRAVLAAALAEVGRPAEAAEVVRALVRAAEERGGPRAGVPWREQLARYEKGEAWRAP